MYGWMADIALWWIGKRQDTAAHIRYGRLKWNSACSKLSCASLNFRSNVWLEIALVRCFLRCGFCKRYSISISPRLRHQCGTRYVYSLLLVLPIFPVPASIRLFPALIRRSAPFAIQYQTAFRLGIEHVLIASRLWSLLPSEKPWSVSFEVSEFYGHMDIPWFLQRQNFFSRSASHLSII